MTTIEKRPGLSAAEAFRQRPLSPVQRLQRLLHKHPEISPLAVLVVAALAFQMANGRFMLPSNLSLILQQV